MLEWVGYFKTDKDKLPTYCRQCEFFLFSAGQSEYARNVVLLCFLPVDEVGRTVLNSGQNGRLD